MENIAIIFDFDGVILESVDVKTEAFRELFSFVPDHVERIVAFHKKNGGMSRFDKFRYIYANILHQDLPEEQFQQLSEQFGVLVFEKVIAASFVPGAREFLEKNYRKFPLFVVSATPEPELLQIIRKKEIALFFRGVYGAPMKKTEHIRSILAEYRINKDNMFFIGDALNDLQAAKNTGIHFIGRILPGGPDSFSGIAGVDFTIRTIDELDHFFERGGPLC